MPRLGEFIGALLSDAAQARVRADMEALKIAEAYSAHDLLKHLPVPRFRLPDIVVDVPVLVASLEDAPAGGAGRLFEPPNRDELAKIVQRSLGESDIRLNNTMRNRVLAVFAQRAKQVFEAEPGYLLSPSKASGELAAAAAGEVRASLKDRDPDLAKIDELEASIRSSVKALLLARIAKSPGLQVSVAAGEIKAHGDNDSIMRVRLTITEDAYEVIDRDEGRGFILTPE